MIKGPGSCRAHLEIKDFQKKVPIVAIRIKRIILTALSKARCKKFCEITVCFVDDRSIKKLNREFHHCNLATDVLTFDLCPENKKKIIADIVVSAETAVLNAKRFGTTCNYELELYVVHGVLHLLGYNDLTIKQRNIMQDKAERILAFLDCK